MSAIAGLFYRDGRPVGRSTLDGMTEALAHRGPDAAGAWSDGSVGLGHRMLWTTPESLHEELPLTNKNSDVTITADARIDNRDELLAELGLAPWAHGGISDSELILRAYERWGDGAPERLVGDFAFAIWDERRQALFCARDHLGVKPFYYHQSSRAFVFASEIKALVTVPEVPRRLNATRVGDYLGGIFEDQESTFYRDVFRFPAGHFMVVARRSARTRAYYRLDPSRAIRLRSDDEYADSFRERFTDAVRGRLRSAFPVGSSLSGGLDSSSIVGTARAVLSASDAARLHTFSAIFPGLPEAERKVIDERPFQDAVLAMNGLEPHRVEADRLSPLGDVDRVLWHEDEPVLAPNLYLHWALYGAARQQNVRVLLDGLDGDTTVSHGLEHLSELARRGQVRTLRREVRALAGRYRTSPRRLLWQFGLGPLVPEPVQRVWRALSNPTRPAWGFNPTISRAFARRVALAERARALRAPETTTARTAREGHRRALTSPLLAYVLEVADKAAAAFGLEPRYPFFDRRLMEFCLALPPEQKLHDGWTRVVMRRAMAGTIPDDVRWRVRKADLSPNFKRRLLEADRAVLDDVIVKDPRVLEDYVDVAALRRVYGRFTAQPTAEDDALAIYSAVVLALWLRRTGVSS